MTVISIAYCPCIGPILTVGFVWSSESCDGRTVKWSMLDQILVCCFSINLVKDILRCYVYGQTSKFSYASSFSPNDFRLKTWKGGRGEKGHLPTPSTSICVQSSNEVVKGHRKTPPVLLNGRLSSLNIGAPTKNLWREKRNNSVLQAKVIKSGILININTGFFSNSNCIGFKIWTLQLKMLLNGLTVMSGSMWTRSKDTSK